MFEMTWREKFEQFHEDHPEVYEEFKKFADMAYDSGRPRFSSVAVVERVRWETFFEYSDREFKINNNYRAYYSRMYMEETGRHGFFETRIMKH